MSSGLVGERQITVYQRRLCPKCVETRSCLRRSRRSERNLLFISPLHYGRPNIGLVRRPNGILAGRRKEGREVAALEWSPSKYAHHRRRRGGRGEAREEWGGAAKVTRNRARRSRLAHFSLFFPLLLHGTALPPSLAPGAPWHVVLTCAIRLPPRERETEQHSILRPTTATVIPPSGPERRRKRLHRRLPARWSVGRASVLHAPMPTGGRRTGDDEEHPAISNFSRIAKTFSSRDGREEKGEAGRRRQMGLPKAKKEGEGRFRFIDFHLEQQPAKRQVG